MPTPEDQAREHIDQSLEQAGWKVQDFKRANLGVGRGTVAWLASWLFSWDFRQTFQPCISTSSRVEKERLILRRCGLGLIEITALWRSYSAS
jgi:hypothetical protein